MLLLLLACNNDPINEEPAPTDSSVEWQDLSEDDSGDDTDGKGDDTGKGGTDDTGKDAWCSQQLAIFGFDKDTNYGWVLDGAYLTSGDCRRDKEACTPNQMTLMGKRLVIRRRRESAHCAGGEPCGWT